MPLTAEHTSQIEKAIPSVAPGSDDTKDMPLGATSNSSHLHFEGGASITGLPNASKPSQAPRWSQVLGLVKVAIDSTASVLSGYVDAALHTLQEAIQAQLDQKASRSDLVNLQTAIQSQLDESPAAFDPNSATGAILQLLGLKPPKVFLVGDGESTQITVSHNMEATTFFYTVTDLAKNQTLPLAALHILDSNQVQLNFASAPGMQKIQVLLFPFTGAGAGSGDVTTIQGVLTSEIGKGYLTNENGSSYLIF